jgi:hypothetical protein
VCTTSTLRHDLFSELSVVFMDTTTLYFEGRGGDTLGQKGHSKDYRPHLNQMVVGIIVDQNGRPVCSEMWPEIQPHEAHSIRQGSLQGSQCCRALLLSTQRLAAHRHTLRQARAKLLLGPVLRRYIGVLALI